MNRHVDGSLEAGRWTPEYKCGATIRQRNEHSCSGNCTMRMLLYGRYPLPPLYFHHVRQRSDKGPARIHGRQLVISITRGPVIYAKSRKLQFVGIDLVDHSDYPYHSDPWGPRLGLRSVLEMRRSSSLKCYRHRGRRVGY